MKIIIAGIGKLGSYLTRSLVEDKHEITIIDDSFRNAQELINNVDINYILGNALDFNILKEAGIETADLFIAVMDKDEKNVISCMLSKKLGVKNTIARIRDPEYAGAVNLLQYDLGLSLVINPEKLTALNISKALSIPSALEAVAFFKGKMQMITIKLDENSPLNGMSLSSFSKKNVNIIVCAIDRDGQIIIPSGKTRLEANDKIHVAGTVENIKEFLVFSNLIKKKTKKVIISGGSKTAIYLAEELIKSGMEVKIIEIDENRCQEISEILPNALVILADASNQDILYEEGIDSCDAFIALTSIDEENIVYSMFASLNKVPKIITKINHIDLDGVVDKAGIDTIVTPHRIATNHVVKYVRAMQNSHQSSCEAVYKFDDDVFEMMEFRILEDFKGINKKIKDMHIKENVLIVAILRDKTIIYPGGNETIKVHDTLVLIDGTNEVVTVNDMME